MWASIGSFVYVRIDYIQVLGFGFNQIINNRTKLSEIICMIELFVTAVWLIKTENEIPFCERYFI